jgi:hypothetical protein
LGDEDIVFGAWAICRRADFLARFCKGFFGCFEFFFRFDFEGDTAIGLAPEMKGKLYGRDGQITRGGRGWTSNSISAKRSASRFDFLLGRLFRSVGALGFRVSGFGFASNWNLNLTG